MREVRPGVWELSISDAGTRRYRTVRGTRDDAISALGAFAAEINGHHETVDALIVAYLKHLGAQGRSPTTIHRYRQLWRHWLSPTLAHLPPAALRPPDLEEPLVAMGAAGQSPSSIHQAAVLLSGCFAWAKRQGTLETKPAYGLRLPDGTRLASPRIR
jgi:site-specific recombinase XerC